MGTLVTALFIVGLVLAIVDQIRAEGKSVTDWAVIAVALGLVLLRVT